MRKHAEKTVEAELEEVSKEIAALKKRSLALRAKLQEEIDRRHLAAIKKEIHK